MLNYSNIFHKKHSIKNKFFIYLLSVSLIPFILFNTISISFVYYKFKEAEKKHFIEQMNAINQDVDIILKQMDQLLLNILNNPMITQAISSPYMPPSEHWFIEKQQVELLLHSYLVNHEGLSINLISKHKNFLSRNRAYFNERMDSLLSTYVLENKPSYMNKRFISPHFEDSITLVKPLYLESSPIGIIYIDFDPTKLKELLAPFNTSDIKFYIVDENEALIYTNTDTHDSFSNTQDLSTQELRTYLTGSNHLFITQASSYSNWKFIVALPREYIFAQTYVLLVFSALISSLIIIGSFILSRLVSQKLTASILNLVATTTAFVEHFSTVDIDYDCIDEIELLERSIFVMNNKIYELIENIQIREQQKKELEFQFLQSQINPHMIYNTLNTITHLAKLQNIPNIQEVSVSFAHLLKSHYSSSQEFITLKEEYENLKNYINIKKYNIYTPIFLNKEFSEELASRQVLKLSLQPLVENCIFHGVDEDTISLQITVKAFAKDEIIYITIADNGIGIPSDRLNEILDSLSDPNLPSEHIALRNLKQRLQLYYGEQAGLNIVSTALGTHVSLWFPCNTFRKDICYA